jgi:uncharacterized protein involved in type VI secretion and phage assembly
MSDDGTKRYYGKYRASVINNIDPEQRGRIMVQVPAAGGLVPSTWALPCLPIAGTQSGIYAVPQIGSSVWVEFENGDPDYPIWVGGWWGSMAEVPVPALPPLSNPASPSIVLQTILQNSISISDVPGPTGGIMLKSTTGASIIVNDTGIYISNGKGAMITMLGPAVDINAGALTIL